MKDILKKLKNLATIIGGFSLLFIAGFFLYMVMTDGGSFSKDITVIGETQVEIPQIQKFSVSIADKTYAYQNAPILDKDAIYKEMMDDIQKEFAGNSLVEDAYQDARRYPEKSFYQGGLYVYVQKQADADRLESFIKDSFKEYNVQIYSQLVNDEYFFEIDENKLLTDAMQNAKEKAEHIAAQSDLELDGIKRVDEDGIYGDYDSGQKDENLVTKKIKVVYTLK